MRRIIIFLIFCIILKTSCKALIQVDETKTCIIYGYSDTTQKILSEITKKNDSSFVIKTYRYDSSKLYILYLKSINPENKHGRYVSFYSNNKVHCNGQYAENIPYGEWRYYKENGELDTVINYDSAIRMLMAPEINKPIYAYTEIYAKFNGSDINEFYLYLQKNIKFPDCALKNKKTGQVIIQFVVDDLGNITNVKALRSVDIDFSMEIIRILEKSPKWEPAKQNNQAVSKQFIIPIAFDIKR
jgi:TonB family protein